MRSQLVVEEWRREEEKNEEKCIKKEKQACDVNTALMHNVPPSVKLGLGLTQWYFFLWWAVIWIPLFSLMQLYLFFTWSHNLTCEVPQYYLLVVAVHKHLLTCCMSVPEAYSSVLTAVKCLHTVCSRHRKAFLFPSCTRHNTRQEGASDVNWCNSL